MCCYLTFAQVSTKNEILPVIDISGGFSNNQKISLSKIAGSVRYIPLETKKETYISKVTKAHFTDKEIIVFDEKSNQILRFDLEGKFLGPIGRGGKGPGEYIRVNNIEINHSNGIIYVFDIGLGKVLKFNLEGKFLGNNKNPLLGFWVTMISDKYFAYFDPARSVVFAGGYYKTIITDLDGKILQKSGRQKQSKEEKFKSPCSMQSAVYLNDGNACYWEVTSDTIFRVTPDLNFGPYACVNQGPRSLPKEKMYDAEYVMKSFNEHSTIISLLETDSYFFGRGITNNQGAAILYFKDTRACFNVSDNRNYLSNDLDNGPGFWPVGKASSHSLYSTADPAELKALSKNPNLGSRLRKIAETIEEGDNPVLVVVELK
jgi:hypothetical protein